jgi:hypothetical protein
MAIMQGPPLYTSGLHSGGASGGAGAVAEAFSNPLQSPQPVAAGRQGAEATLGPYMTGTERSALVLAVEENKL